MQPISPILCVHCGSALRVEADGAAVCAHCGVVHSLPRSLCPQCHFLNPQESESCARCGAAVTTICTECGGVNWAGAGRCVHCRRNFRSLDHAFQDFQHSYAEGVEERKAGVPDLRREEEEESQDRLRVLEEADRRRIQRNAETAALRAAREKNIILLVCVVVGLSGLIALIALFLGLR
jgi:hypothetical protein